MIVAYDGTKYSGWQVQPHHKTIQSEMERVIRELTGETVRVDSSGRTDAGVHARGQVVHFDLASKPVLWKFQQGLNALLDHDIRVLSVRNAPADFHSRISATGKEYRYFIWNDSIMLPFLRHYRAHVRKPAERESNERSGFAYCGQARLRRVLGQSASRDQWNRAAPARIEGHEERP
jgi:tRNA pseudouridine38-40 synthase